jgi:hypothetical protein
MLSIANDRASRLHQATILSSKPHRHILLYCPLPHMQVFYHLFLQNILSWPNLRGASRERGKVNTKTGLSG